MIRTIGQCILIPLLHLLQYLYGLKHPIRQRRIMLYAHRRRGIVCNPKYILQEIIRQSNEMGALPYEIYWVTQYPETIPESSNYQVVKYRSFAYFRLFAQTKLYITNDMLDELLHKRKGQVVLGTWHGGWGYKKTGMSVVKSRWKRYLYQLYYSRIDYMLSDSVYDTKMHKAELGINETCSLQYGYPRNDIFYEMHSEVKERVLQFYKLPREVKIVLYAPTYRKERGQYQKYLTAEGIDTVLEALKEKFGGDWVCIYRLHYFTDKEKRNLEHKSILDGNSYYDMQELLYCAQVLITDYSSSMWDFAIMEKPIFCYMPDLEKYVSEDRGFYIPIKLWPYPKAFSEKELVKRIQAFEEEGYKKELEKHKRFVGAEAGNEASKKAFYWIETVCSKKIEGRI